MLNLSGTIFSGRFDTFGVPVSRLFGAERRGVCVCVCVCVCVNATVKSH